jgi:hypothetical protein
VKKDILAAITFLTTGVLIYLAQVDGAPQKVLSSDDECGVVETIVVEENSPETPKELVFRDPRTRDS